MQTPTIEQTWRIVYLFFVEDLTVNKISWLLAIDKDVVACVVAQEIMNIREVQNLFGI